MTRPFALAFVLLLSAGAGMPMQAAAPEDAPILHALNRLTYGPRPGDVERVKAMGLQKWIELQLTPSRIDDRALEARLQRLETLTLDAETIQREYAAPAMAERRQKKAAEGADQTARATEGTESSELMSSGATLINKGVSVASPTGTAIRYQPILQGIWRSDRRAA